MEQIMVDYNWKFLLGAGLVDCFEEYYSKQTVDESNMSFRIEFVIEFARMNKGIKQVKSWDAIHLGIIERVKGRRYRFTKEFHQYMALPKETRYFLRNRALDNRAKQNYLIFVPAIADAIENKYKPIDTIISPHVLCECILETPEILNKMPVIPKQFQKTVSKTLNYHFNAEPFSTSHRVNGSSYCLPTDVATAVANARSLVRS